MWIRGKSKVTFPEAEMQTYACYALDAHRIAADFVFLGSFEAALAAILQKIEQPESRVALVFKPTARDFALPARFSALRLEDFTNNVSGYSLPAYAHSATLDLQKNGVLRRTQLMITDMRHSFEARSQEGNSGFSRFKDEHDTRHSLPQLSRNMQALTLEGSVELKGGCLLLLDQLLQDMLEKLKSLEVMCFMPSSIQFLKNQIIFTEGGSVDYGNVQIVDLFSTNNAAYQPVIGLQTDFAQDNSVVFEDFHCFRIYCKETLFFGSASMSLEQLKAQIKTSFDGLQGCKILRQFYLPVAKAALDQNYTKPESLFSRLETQNITPFGLQAILALAAANTGKTKLYDETALQEAEQCFNGRS
jgi:hypothetical protein